MVIIKKELLDKILADLNLTSKQVIEEGMWDRFKTGVSTTASNIGQGIKNLAQAGAAAPANVGRTVSNAVGNAFQTDAAIIQAGLLFKDKNGNFVGVANVDPKSKEGQFLNYQYTQAGYTPADGTDRMAASRQKITVHRPENMVNKNLKLTTTQALEQLKNLTGQLEKTVASKPVFTDQDANALYTQLVQFIKNSITTAQGNLYGNDPNNVIAQAPAKKPRAKKPAPPKPKKLPTTIPVTGKPISQPSGPFTFNTKYPN